MRWADVVPGGNPWETPLIMVTFHDAAGTQLGGWPQVSGLLGSSDWHLVQLDSVEVPLETRRVVVYLGLQNCAGSAWYTDVGLTASEPYRG